MPKRSRKGPGDPNQLAKRIVQEATGEPQHPQAHEDAPTKNPAAVALGRLGGLRGGKARAESLTKAERSKIAKKAAQARWGKDSTNGRVGD